MEQFLKTGKIVGTHGIKGEMRVEPWCDSPEFLKNLKNLYFDQGKQKVAVKSSRVHKNLVLLTVEGVDSIEQADLLRGKVLYLDRGDVKLEEGQTFIEDLIGLTVRDGETGRVYGKITEVFATGANDVYRIKHEAGAEYLFPAVKHMIKETDLTAGVIEVLPIPGIFDEEGLSDAL